MHKQTQGARKRGFCECESQVGCFQERPTAQAEFFCYYSRPVSREAFDPQGPMTVSESHSEPEGFGAKMDRMAILCAFCCCERQGREP